jgi:hypothetical protein
MREELVPLLTVRVGLEQEKAERTIDAVLNYLRDNPQQLSTYLEAFRLGGLASKVGGLFS